MNKWIEKVLMMAVFVLVMVRPADALELSLGLGGCDSGSVRTVCNASDHVIVHYSASQRWPINGGIVPNGLSVELRYDHFSHYDHGELDPSNDKFFKENTGYIDAMTLNLVLEW